MAAEQGVRPVAEALQDVAVPKSEFALAGIGEGLLGWNAQQVAAPNVTIEKSKAWDRLDVDLLKLTNNVWGALAGEKLDCGVYLNQNGAFGWYWSRPGPKTESGATYAKPIYPSVRIGGSPWEASSINYFPVRLADLKSLKFDVAYKYVNVPDGSFNFAYDMFLVDTDRPSRKPQIKAEVMIWIHGTAKEPPNSYKGDFSDGNNTYQLFSWVMNDGRLYYAFVMKGDLRYDGRHTVDAGRLLAALNLDPQLYVHGVELGNEIWNGSGKIEIGSFNVNVNGYYANPPAAVVRAID